MKRWRNFIVIGIVFLIVCVLTAAVASAAQASLPGDRMYPVKLTLERLRLGLAVDDVSRARLCLEFVENRLAELDQISDPLRLQPALQALDQALVDAIRAVAALPDEAQGDMRAQLARLALRAADVLARWQATAGDGALLARLLKFVRALAKVAADPNTSAANLLLLLEQLPAGEEEAVNIPGITRGVRLPADLIAKHQPPFIGRHGELACSTCHIDGKVEGLSAACTTCHEDPHLGKFERLGHDCTGCHTDVSFIPSTFEHTRFPDCQSCHVADTPPNHFPGQCSNCHTTNVWKPANFNHTGFTDCAGCHSGDAPPNHFPGQCSTCHSTDQWKPANFNHAGLTDCAGCHSGNAPPNHFPGQCSTCHNTDQWKPANFNHAGLTDCAGCHSGSAPPNHFPGQCSTCHNTDQWKPANFNHAGLTDCAGCHSGNAPPNHFPGQCSDCHNTDSWGGASFNHTFPINHHDANGECAKCHPGGDTSTWTCATCHEQSKMDEKHREISGYSGNCVACHADGRKP